MSTFLVVLAVGAARVIALIVVCSAIEAVVTNRLPWDSWQETGLLVLGGAAWTCGDVLLTTINAH